MYDGVATVRSGGIELCFIVVIIAINVEKQLNTVEQAINGFRQKFTL